MIQKQPVPKVVLAKYLNRTGARIELGIGSRPGEHWDRYDSNDGEIVEGPAVPAYERRFIEAGYTKLTDEEVVQYRVAKLLAEAKAIEQAKAEAKAKAEAEAAANKEREEVEVKAKAEAEQPIPASPALEDLPIAKPIEKVKARGTHR